MFNKSTQFSKNETAPERKAGVNAQFGTGAPSSPLQSSLQSATAARSASASANEGASVGESHSGQDSGSRLIVGPDVKLKGAEILDCDTLVVEGRVEATMDSRVIRIAEHGSFSGKVCIDVAEIHGKFDGELTARQQLIVHATGRVNGTVRYGKILIEEGGEISGDIKSLSSGGAEKPAPSIVTPFVASSGS